MSALARVYVSGTEPMLVSGTAASNAAGAGTPQPNGRELATIGNAALGRDYQDNRTK
jgi:hypothetical protein